MLGCIQPISSPMMKRMFGFRSWAAAGALAAVMAASEARRPSEALLIVLMLLSRCRLPERGRQPLPADVAARSRLDANAFRCGSHAPACILDTHAAARRTIGLRGNRGGGARFAMPVA